jgi:Tfp pilus assembly protein PilN
MITLNLTTEQIKKDLLSDKIFCLANDILLIILFTVVVNAIFVFISHKTLENNFKKIQAQHNLITLKNQPFDLEIAGINRDMDKIDKIQKQYTKWSEILAEINKLIPSGIKIKQMNLNALNKSFNVVATAELRSDFLIFKENLEKSELITDVVSPLANLLHDKNFEFSLDAKLQEKNE